MAPPTAQSKPQPLPLAPDRAALSNRISMLLASQSSVLKTMKLTRPDAAAASRPQHHRRTAAEDEDEDMRKASRPNEGVGYVADAGKNKTDLAREDKILRNRLLGKRGADARGRGASAASAKDGSDSDEDVGRSALGKRKRPRRTEPAVASPTEETGMLDDAAPGPGQEEGGEAEARVDGHHRTGDEVEEIEKEGAGTADTEVGATSTTVTEDAGARRKKKKKPKKKKNKAAGMGMPVDSAGA